MSFFGSVYLFRLAAAMAAFCTAYTRRGQIPQKICAHFLRVFFARPVYQGVNVCL